MFIHLNTKAIGNTVFITVGNFIEQFIPELNEFLKDKPTYYVIKDLNSIVDLEEQSKDWTIGEFPILSGLDTEKVIGFYSKTKQGEVLFVDLINGCVKAVGEYRRLFDSDLQPKFLSDFLKRLYWFDIDNSMGYADKQRLFFQVDNAA